MIQISILVRGINVFQNHMISCERNRSVSPYNRNLWEPWLSRGPTPSSISWHIFKCLYITQLLYKQMFHFYRASGSNLVGFMKHDGGNIIIGDQAVPNLARAGWCMQPCGPTSRGLMHADFFLPLSLSLSPSRSLSLSFSLSLSVGAQGEGESVQHRKHTQPAGQCRHSWLQRNKHCCSTTNTVAAQQTLLQHNSCQIWALLQHNRNAVLMGEECTRSCSHWRLRHSAPSRHAPPAVCCSVLQCVAVHCSVPQLWMSHVAHDTEIPCAYKLQCVAVCCSVLQCDSLTNESCRTWYRVPLCI